MCSWRPSNVICGLAVDQWMCFRSRRVAMLSLVLWAIPRRTMRAVGCGTWSGSVLVAPLFIFLVYPIPVGGAYPEYSGLPIEPRNYLDGSLPQRLPLYREQWGGG